MTKPPLSSNGPGDTIIDGGNEWYKEVGELGDDEGRIDFDGDDEETRGGWKYFHNFFC